MSTSDDEMIDPFEAHFHRDPLPGAAVRVVVLVNGDFGRAEEVARSLVERLISQGRAAESRVVPIAGQGQARALDHGIEGATTPLILVTSAEEPWSAEHLEPLLRAIDHCDHVLGRRR